MEQRIVLFFAATYKLLTFGSQALPAKVLCQFFTKQQNPLLGNATQPLGIKS